MLCFRSDADITRACGETFMHPAATRAFRVPTGRVSADRAMRDMLEQYGNLIRQRTEKVRSNAPRSGEPDMRTGWLLWQESLRQFLYFEEPMRVPNPDEFRATWVNSGGGARIASRNLWIYDKATNRKRFSVTTAAGAKIQPYFEVPLPDDPNLYVFTVIGEVIATGHIRCWLTRTTFEELRALLGNTEAETIEKAIYKHVSELPVAEAGPLVEQAAVSVEVTSDAYKLLLSRLPGVNDDHCFQLLIGAIRKHG